MIHKRMIAEASKISIYAYQGDVSKYLKDKAPAA